MIEKPFKWVFLFLIFISGMFIATNDHVGVKNETFFHSKLISIPTQTMRNLTNPSQIHCLVLNTYHEARGEPIEGQAAVIRVVINRVLHKEFKNTPCGVIKDFNYVTRYDSNNQPILTKVCQFSWYCEKNITSVSITSKVYKDIEKLVINILVNNAYYDVVSEDTLFFHSIHVNPKWVYNRLKKIGNHIFYEDQ
jgi:spore germination cell wall hydrolase CwlJ-like protein